MRTRRSIKPEKDLKKFFIDIDVYRDYVCDSIGDERLLGLFGLALTVVAKPSQVFDLKQHMPDSEYLQDPDIL